MAMLIDCKSINGVSMKKHKLSDLNIGTFLLAFAIVVFVFSRGSGSVLMIVLFVVLSLCGLYFITQYVVQLVEKNKRF